MNQSPALLFQRLRVSLLRNTLRLVRERSLSRVITILACSLIIWSMLFYVSWVGFSELKLRWEIPLDIKLMSTLFDFLFLALTIMLIFSTGIILYSSLFSSQESQFLLSTPLPDDQIFAYKFQGAVAFSSWAFILLGSPILIAYGLEVRDGAPWYFYAVMPLFFLGFVLLPGSLGALFALLLVNFVPKRKKQVMALIVGVVVLLGVLWGTQAIMEARQSMPGSRAWFDSLLGEINSIRDRLVPVQWIGLGLKAAALGHAGDMAYYLALIWSNGLMLYLGTMWLARLWYRRGFNREATGGTLRKRYGGGWLDRLVERAMFFLDHSTRLLIVKDFRTFRRDPAQWLQILIFLGLGVLYFSNVRKFYEQDLGKTFQNGISLLTLTATSFLMCAYTGRFIFPMLSLEGRKFWILGLLPFDRDRLLWGKFAFSATGCLIFAEFLVIFSNLMLQMPMVVVIVHALTIGVLAFGLSGLSVGLVACLPNFRETDPSKIAVGFGGTLNLVAGLLLLIAVVGLMAAPFHAVLATGLDRELPLWPWGSLAAGVLVGVLAVVIPLRAGVKNLRAMEF